MVTHPIKSGPRFQFSLRTLLISVPLLAAFFAVWSRTSLFEAAACALSCFAIWAGFRSRVFRRLGIVPRLLAVVIGITALWFVAVDESVYVDTCPDCYHCGYVVQYRVAGFVVSEKTYSNALSGIEQVASYLGLQCPHKSMDRRQKYRFWGLLICRCPCHNGIDALVGDESPAYLSPAASDPAAGTSEPNASRGIQGAGI